jgi:hypothetical protein
MNKYIVPLAIAAAAFTIPSSAHADGPSVRAEATCTTFTIHIEGLSPGDKVFAEQGSTPPSHLTVSAVGTVDTTIPSASNPWFTADVLVQHDGQLVTVYHALVDCTTPEYVGTPAVDPVPADVEPVTVVAPVERPRRIAERLTRFGMR